MSIEKRLTELEQATQAGDPEGPKMVVRLSWGPEDEIIVDGVTMTESEFAALWPGWKPDKEITLDWGDDYETD